MKKYLKIIISIMLVCVFAYFYAHIGKTHTIYDRHVDSSTYISTPIFEEATQSFKCTEDTLDAVNIKMSTTGDISGIKLRVRIVDASNGDVLASTTKKATGIKSGKLNTFTFDTIKSCKGKDLIVHILSENSDINTGNGITLAYQPQEVIQTEFELNKNKMQGVLIIKTVTNRFDFETFSVVLIFAIYMYLFMAVLYKLFK